MFPSAFVCDCGGAGRAGVGEGSTLKGKRICSSWEQILSF